MRAGEASKAMPGSVRTPRRRSASASWRKKSSSNTSRRKPGVARSAAHATSVPGGGKCASRSASARESSAAARAHLGRQVVHGERRVLVHEPLHELAQRRVLVVGGPRVDGDDPPEARRVSGLELLHLGLAHLVAAAEALGHLPRAEERVTRSELLDPPRRRVEEDELERAGRVGEPDLEERAAVAHPLHADVTDGPVDDPLVAGTQLRDAPNLRAVLVRLREELERLLDGGAPALLELRARRRVGAGQLRERRGEPLPALGPLRRRARRRGLGPGVGPSTPRRLRRRYARDERPLGRGRGRGRPSTSLRRRGGFATLGMNGLGRSGRGGGRGRPSTSLRRRRGFATLRMNGLWRSARGRGRIRPPPLHPPTACRDVRPPEPRYLTQLLRHRDERRQPAGDPRECAAAAVGRERVERLGLGGETLEGGRARSARGARPGDGTAGELAETPQPRRAGEAVLHREPQRWDERRERLLRGGKAGGDLPGGGHVALVAPPLHGARLPARSDYSPDSPGSSSSTNEMDWISYSFWPPGVRTVTVSPSSRPMSARAMGLVTEMRPTLEVRLELADNPVGHLVARVGFLERDRRAEDHARRPRAS